jgi:hypothetical protein
VGTPDTTANDFATSVYKPPTQIVLPPNGIATFFVFPNYCPLNQYKDQRRYKCPHKVKSNESNDELVDVVFSWSLVQDTQQAHKEQKKARKLEEWKEPKHWKELKQRS